MRNARSQSIFIALAVAGVTALAAPAFAKPPPPTKPTKTIKIEAAPQQTGMSKLSPAGTTNSSDTPQRNLIPNAVRPQSPTPPGFMFAAPGGSWAPGGPPVSGSVPAFTVTPTVPGSY